MLESDWSRVCWATNQDFEFFKSRNLGRKASVTKLRLLDYLTKNKLTKLSKKHTKCPMSEPFWPKYKKKKKRKHEITLVLGCHFVDIKITKHH